MTSTSPESRSGWTLWLLLLAAVQILVLWLSSYSEGNLDDKAVHYYSAARLFAQADKTAPLDGIEHLWLNKLPADRQFRTRNRLHSFAVYPVYGGILRAVCAAWPGDQPPHSFSIPVKLSFLILFLLALGWLLAITAAHPVDGILAASCLLLGGLGLSVPFFAPAAGHGMAFLAYAPRGPAILLILAAFACFARDRNWLAGASLLLAFAWHAGFAAVAVPCTLGAFAITLCDRANNTRIRIIGAILTAGLALVLTRLGSGPFLPYTVWLPAGLVILFLLAGPKVVLAPLWRATASLAAFLFLTETVTLALGYTPCLEGLVRITGNPLVAEIPARLTGIRHLAGLALTLTVTLGLINMALPNRMEFNRKRLILLAGATCGLCIGIVWGMSQWPTAGRKAAIFLHSEEGLAARKIPSAGALETLDPRQETAFFAALGDYLLAPKTP